MKENNKNEINEEDEDLKKINEMLIQVNKKKEYGNQLVTQKKYKEAEEVYLEAFEIINKFETKKKFELDNEEKKAKGKEIINTIKTLYSNIALCQGKQLKIHEAIQTSSYIISNLDGYHDKSYLRIMMWMIEIGELSAAEEIQKEIKNKFYGEKLKVFNSAFNLLKIKKEEAEEKLRNRIKNNQEGKNIDLKEIINNGKKVKNKKKEEKTIFNLAFNKYKFLTIGLGGLIGGIGIFLLYKYRNK